MIWVKRNLYFLIGSVVALGLMAGAVLFAFQKNRLNNEQNERLNQAYAELKGLKEQKPHPGDGKNVDNIKLAREQQGELRGWMAEAGVRFQRIAAIPSGTNFSTLEFTEQLRQTITGLQKAAGAGSVMVASNYNFSFEAQRNKLTLAAGSLEPLAEQLGEVKALCEVLYRGRINALESIRRERVSADDAADRAGMMDYHEQKSVTNEMGVTTRYELTFRAFSAELAAVLGGLATAPHGIIVQGIAVEPANITAPAPGETPMPILVPVPEVTLPRITPPQNIGGVGEGALNATRFAPPPVAAAPVRYVASAPGAALRPPPVLNERLLRVTLVTAIVKLRPTAPPGNP